MFVYLWNLCKFVLLKIAALSWNVVSKLVQGEQPQQLNNTPKRKVRVSMANEVWTEVLSFVKRVELARTVSLTNWQIHDICWPRLHGYEVMAHEVRKMVIARKYADDGWSATAKLLINGKEEVPFANCPPPDYITGFYIIRFHYLDDQVLAFIKVIAPHLTAGIYFSFVDQMRNLDAQQHVFINQLLTIFREEKSPNAHLAISTMLDSIPFLPDLDNKTLFIQLGVADYMDFQLLMKMLTTPRPDGKQRVIRQLFFFGNGNDQSETAMKMLDAIKQHFRTSTKPLPQPFYITCTYPGLLHNLPRSEEENARTDETLTISAPFVDEDYNEWCIDICRHPKGEDGKWAEDAQQRTRAVMIQGRETNIRIKMLGPWTRN